jgi:hypothetical protein
MGAHTSLGRGDLCRTIKRAPKGAIFIIMRFLKSPLFWFAAVWGLVFWYWGYSMHYQRGDSLLFNVLAAPVEVLSLPFMILALWIREVVPPTLGLFFEDDFPLLAGFFIEGLFIGWVLSKILGLFIRRTPKIQ